MNKGKDNSNAIPRIFFTSPENVGEWYFHVFRKCGGAVFSLVQKMWARWYFHVSRKCGLVKFSRVQKMWECSIFTCPENVGAWFFHLFRKFRSASISLDEDMIIPQTANAKRMSKSPFLFKLSFSVCYFSIWELISVGLRIIVLSNLHVNALLP
jgi:hypothetical protein